MAIKLKTAITKQIPEFVRADYPHFVEFVQAYYEFMDTYYIKDITALRDLDTTLDDFITYFKKELDLLGNVYPYIDEKLFLRKSKELFTAKGTEASYKLVFKILSNRDAEIAYPWDSVLKPSDGRWQQENSLFVRMAAGDATDLVGNTAVIHGKNTRLRVFVERVVEVPDLVNVAATNLIAGNTYTISEVGTTNFTLVGAPANIPGATFVATGRASGTGVVTFDKRVYEIFINKDYYGTINVGETLELVQRTVTFNAIKDVRPETNSIYKLAHGFVTGDSVIYTHTGGLTVGGLLNGASYYIIKIDNNNFRLAVTESNAKAGVNITINSNGIGEFQKFSKSIRGEILPTTVKYTIVKPGSGYKIGSLIYGTTISDGKKIVQLLKVTQVDDNGGVVALQTIQYGYGYNNDFYLLQASPQADLVTTYPSNFAALRDSISVYGQAIPDDSVVSGYQDYGYIIKPDYALTSYSDVSYAATLLQQFYQQIDSQLGTGVDFVLMRFDLGAVAKYPGQYISNDGFVNDEIYVQDSYKFQKFSYVIKVNEKLDAYKSLIKSLLHPAGTALFADYQITSNYNTQILDGVFDVSEAEISGADIDGNTLTVFSMPEGNLATSTSSSSALVDGKNILTLGGPVTGIFKVGYYVHGTNLVNGCKIAEQITSTDTAAYTATVVSGGQVGTATFTVASLGVHPTTGKDLLVPGQLIKGLGIPDNTFVYSINTTTKEVQLTNKISYQMAGNYSVYAPGGPGTYVLSIAPTGAVSGVVNGGLSNIKIGAYLLSRDVIPGTKISGFLTGTGSLGTYTIDKTHDKIANIAIIATNTLVTGQNNQQKSVFASAASFTTINRTLTDTTSNGAGKPVFDSGGYWIIESYGLDYWDPRTPYGDYDTVTAGSFSATLSNVQITSTGGEFSCDAGTLSIGQKVVIAGTLASGATGIVAAGTYYIKYTNGSTIFTLSTDIGDAITTTVGTTTGLTFTKTAEGETYTIVSLTGTTQAEWNTAAGTSGLTYAVGDRFKVAAGVVGAGTGTVRQSGTIYTTAAQLAAQNP